jgi:hypothetical protein
MSLPDWEKSVYPRKIISIAQYPYFIFILRERKLVLLGTLKASEELSGDVLCGKWIESCK